MKRLYEFGPFRFYPDDRILLCNGKSVRMPGRAKDVFIVLFEKNGEAVSAEELLRAVWGKSGGDKSNLYRAIADCKKALHEFDSERTYIENLREFGYRFIADDVRAVEADSHSLPVVANLSVPVSTVDYSPTPGDPVHNALTVHLPLEFAHTIHLHVASALYGSLFGVMLIAEIAYQFDKHGRAAVPVAILVTLWMYAASVAGLRAAQKVTARQSSVGLIVGTAAFIISAGVLFLSALWFLPPVPITEQTTQASTAQAAYIKVIIYHLLLAIPFLIIPFHFVVAMESRGGVETLPSAPQQLINNGLGVIPRGAVYIRPWVLLTILLFYMAYAGNAHHSLVGSLLPGEYMNLFIILLWVRIAIFFSLAIECLIWYYQRLNELQHRNPRVNNVEAKYMG